MSMRLERELSELTDLFSHLEAEETQTSEEKKALLKAREKVEALLQDPSHLHLKKETLKALDELVAVYNHPSREISKIRAISKHLLTLEPSKKTVERGPIGLNLIFFCDIDSPDHNGAIHREIMNAVDQKIPFVTSRALLQFEKNKGETNSLELRLIKDRENWEIFKKGEMLLFLPRTPHSALSWDKKLQSLDFVHDGSLKRISLHEAFLEPDGPPTFEDFIHLFTPQPRLQKLFYLAGHGSPRAVGALSLEHYQKFLTFLDHQKCRGLTIGSCSTGGESSLASLPYEESGEIASYEEVKEGPKFPLIVRSIGDYPTRLQEGEKDSKTYFEELSKFAETGQERAPLLRRAVQSVEKGAKKEPASFVKVYFPHSKDSPGGFRPLDETETSYSLTYTRVKGQKTLRELSKEPQGYEIQGKSYLQVHPLVTDVPLVFEEKDPELLSMIPGTGHHFISSIHLATHSPIRYLKESIRFQSGLKIGASKGFFIGKLSLNGDTIEEVALKIGPKHSYAVFRHEGQHYFLMGRLSRRISPIEHALYVREIAEQTTPSKKAILASSSGQESEANFREALRGPEFWPSTDKSKTSSLFRGEQVDEIEPKTLSRQEKTKLIFQFLEDGLGQEALELLKKSEISPNTKDLSGFPLLRAACKAGHYPTVLWLIQQGADPCYLDSKTLSQHEKTTLIFHLLEARHGKEALEILKGSDISPDTKDLKNVPLVLAASKSGHYYTLLWLLQHDADVNFSYDDIAFVSRAIKAGDIELLKILMEYSNLELEPDWTRTPPIAGATKGEMIDLLRRYGASINLLREGKTALSIAVGNNTTEAVKLFLQKGADPNLGSPSALTIACQGCNVEMAKSLLEAGGTPFERDASGKIPAIEAVLKGSPEIVKLILDRKDFDPSIQDASGMTLSLAGVISGHPEKIEALKQKGVSFLRIEKYNPQILSNALNRLIAYKDYETIGKIIAWNGGNSSSFEEYVLSFVFFKIVQNNDTPSLKAALSFLGKNKNSLLKVLTSDRFWNLLVTDNQIENTKPILLHTHFEKEIFDKMWSHAKTEGNENFLILLEELGVKFNFRFINGAEQLALTRNNRLITLKTATSIDQWNLFLSNKYKFLDFLYSKGLKSNLNKELLKKQLAVEKKRPTPDREKIDFLERRLLKSQ